MAVTKIPKTTILERLISRVKLQPNGCWKYTGFIHKGYGRFSVGHGFGTMQAHIISYLLLVGPVPEGLELDHICHAPSECAGGTDCQHRSCINPRHLSPVTHEVNLSRGRRVSTNAKKRRSTKTHCPQGHEYSIENTRLYRGMRYCLACRRRHNQASWVNLKLRRLTEH